MQAINRLLRKIVIVYPHLFRCSTIKYHKLLSTFVERPLCCLAFHHILRCSVFKVQFPVSFETRSKRTTLLCASIHSQFEIGGDSRDRTGDLLLARQALSQLSYIPISALNFLRKIGRFAASALQRETSFPLIIPSGLRRDGGSFSFDLFDFR